jgi:hypothetical protein
MTLGLDLGMSILLAGDREDDGKDDGNDSKTSFLSRK